MIPEISYLSTGRIILDLLDKKLGEIQPRSNYKMWIEPFRKNEDLMGYRLEVATEKHPEVYFFCISEDKNGEILIYESDMALDNWGGMCANPIQTTFKKKYKKAATYIFNRIIEIFGEN